MRIVRKSPIPDEKTFVIKDLIAPYFDPCWHFHPEYQLFVVLKGEGTRFIGDNIKPFKASDMVLTGPNLPHLWRNYDSYFKDHHQDQTRGMVIYFQPNILGESLERKVELENILHLFHRSQRGLEITGQTNKIITKMMLDLINIEGTESIIQLLRILNKISESSECHSIAQADYTNLNKDSESDRMSQVYEYVMKNFTRNIRIEEVADISSMSISSFSRYFKSRANKTFSDFLSEIRIGHSCQLLHDEKWNISQICYECGFNALSNFNKQFKKVKGTTPLQYRKAYFKSIEDL